MILREVGESSDVKIDSIHAMLCQRVRANLHHAGRTASVTHLRKRLLQFKRFWRGAIGGQNTTAHVIFHRSNHAGGNIRSRQYMPHHECDSGLTVGTGNPDDLQGTRRVLMNSCRNLSQCLSSIGGKHLLHTKWQAAITLANHSHCPARRRFSGIGVAIGILARKSKEHHAGRHPP